MPIEIDFISVVVGYIVGVCLTWSLTFTLFGCEKCDNEEKEERRRYPYNSIYGWPDTNDSNTYDRIM